MRGKKTEKQKQKNTFLHSFPLPFSLLLFILEDLLFMEQKLLDAVVSQKETLVADLLQAHPGIDVNWRNSSSWTCLHYACRNGHLAILAHLLAHPAINVNIKKADGEVPFMWACFNGHTDCVRLLLGDPRVKVNEPNINGSTSLKWAAYHGHLEVVRWLVASGRELDLGHPGIEGSDAIGAARKRGKTEVAALLERYKARPGEVIQEVRLLLGYYAELAADVFALVIFLCDDYLALRNPRPGHDAKTERFFGMARRLPMELQMVLCHRMAGSMGVNIPGTNSEVAFRELARKLLPAAAVKTR